MSFPEHLQPLDPFIEQNFTYRDGRKPSPRTVRNIKKQLPIVKFCGFEFVDTLVFAERCSQQLDPDPRPRRGRPRAGG
jgi:hypothetical protein